MTMNQMDCERCGTPLTSSEGRLHPDGISIMISALPLKLYALCKHCTRSFEKWLEDPEKYEKHILKKYKDNKMATQAILKIQKQLEVIEKRLEALEMGTVFVKAEPEIAVDTSGPKPDQVNLCSEKNKPEIKELNNGKENHRPVVSQSA